MSSPPTSQHGNPTRPGGVSAPADPSPYAPTASTASTAPTAPPAPSSSTEQAPSSIQSSPTTRKRKAPASSLSAMEQTEVPQQTTGGEEARSHALPPPFEGSPATQPAKRPRTNTPWTPAEEQRLKTMRDAGNSWNEIAKTFPNRTEGSVKKHWYKDMHYADFAEDESAALLSAIRDYEANKWKVIGQKVGKPAKACEQYAREHFGGQI